jgi:prophage regulatory protein
MQNFSELCRNHVLDSRQSADLLSVSLSHFRRLYRARKIPPPIKIGDRKLGWRVGDLVDFVSAIQPEFAGANEKDYG